MFCARSAKFVQVVSCCQVIFIKFTINSPFKLKFYHLFLFVIYVMFLLLTFHRLILFSVIQRLSSVCLDGATFSVSRLGKHWVNIESTASFMQITLTTTHNLHKHNLVLKKFIFINCTPLQLSNVNILHFQTSGSNTLNIRLEINSFDFLLILFV